jgi:hypothetical protein
VIIYFCIVQKDETNIQIQFEITCKKCYLFSFLALFIEIFHYFYYNSEVLIEIFLKIIFQNNQLRICGSDCGYKVFSESEPKRTQTEFNKTSKNIQSIREKI